MMNYSNLQKFGTLLKWTEEWQNLKLQKVQNRLKLIKDLNWMITKKKRTFCVHKLVKLSKPSIVIYCIRLRKLKNVGNIKLIQPTIHKYLSGQTKSQFRRIDADEFMVAALLPVQRFRKASAKEVWSDSRGMI